MGSDLSRQPDDLPELWPGLNQADIVVGFRYVEGGQTLGRPLQPRVISRLASAFARLWLNLSAPWSHFGICGLPKKSCGATAAIARSQGFQAAIGNSGQGLHHPGGRGAHRVCRPSARPVQILGPRGNPIP